MPAPRRDPLWLEVRESNAEARDAYRRLGFTPVGARKGYYPAPEGRREDAVVMSLDVGRDDGAPMRWTERQRAMLREMGIRLWAPERRGEARGDARVVAERASAEPGVGCAAATARRGPRRRRGAGDPLARRAVRRARALAGADWLVVAEPLDAEPIRQQQQLLDNMLRAIGVGPARAGREGRASALAVGTAASRRHRRRDRDGAAALHPRLRPGRRRGAARRRRAARRLRGASTRTPASRSSSRSRCRFCCAIRPRRRRPGPTSAAPSRRSA